MVRWRRLGWLVVLVHSLSALAAGQEPQGGAIRGVVYDKDFDAPLASAQVQVVETGQAVLSSEQGQYVLSGLPPGTYTVVAAKEGYVRQVRPGVVVTAGALTDLDLWLAGEYTEMDEFVVQDLLQMGAGSEALQLKLRFESPSFMDSIGADLMSRAGAGDAASALKLVSGASLQDGKFAVIRGLPDRYVSSQLNGVRLPSADEDTRAVELDQFPAAVIESIQVSKTFTPDQQGDASGGAVNVRVKSIPDETILQLNLQTSVNSQVKDSDFLTYDGGDRDIQYSNIGQPWTGDVGVTRGDPPLDYKWSAAAGSKTEIDDGVTLGGFVTVFYERDSSFYDDGRNDSLWVTTPGGPMVPKTSQGAPAPGGGGDFKTSLFDVTQSSESEQWGGLGAVGLETERNRLGLSWLYTRLNKDTTTLAEDTRGKEFFYPGYDPNDPTDPGNQKGAIDAAPYLRTETLDYTERTTSSIQLTGTHELPVEEFLIFHEPELDWTVSDNTARLEEPDKRQFGTLMTPGYNDPGFPPIIPPFFSPPTWKPFKPGANFNFGNLQRIFKEIEEKGDQVSMNLKLPFDQWAGEEGYVKVGLFDDRVKRTFDQDTFSNSADTGPTTFPGSFDSFWSAVFPFEPHPINAVDSDVDYKGDQKISAQYGMVDLPLTSDLSFIGGARYETTDLSIKNSPEPFAQWIAPGEIAPTTLDPGEGDVDFSQNDVLPSLGLVYEATDEITLRASYSQTVARQTFKELTPILQQEFLGGPVFIGNPELQMSALTNYDLRADYVPREGELVSVSWFDKDVDDPIEYVQRPGDFDFTTAVNYPEGKLSGYEFEVREALGHYVEALEGLSVGANATLIDSRVNLPEDEILGFQAAAIQAPMNSRDMTNAPEHLYNLYLTYDLAGYGTQFALFYTIKGDTLVAGAGEAGGNFVPNVYEKEYGTLNLTISQELSEHAKLILQGKNLTNSEIEEVYRSEFIGDDVLKSSYTKGVEFSIGLNLRF